MDKETLKNVYDCDSIEELKNQEYTELAMKIYYNNDSGELLLIEESYEFKCEDSLLRADVLQDIVGEVESTYKKSLGGFQKELANMSKDEIEKVNNDLYPN